MTNKALSKHFKLAATLLELHGANPFKTRAYVSVSNQLEQLEGQASQIGTDGLSDAGISKNMLAKIEQLLEKGTFDELEELLSKTPEGVVAMTEIKGIGPKKIRTLWQELGLETMDALLLACQTGKVAQLKGFGEKTQKLIIEQIKFMQRNASRLRFADAEMMANELLQNFRAAAHGARVEVAGQIRLLSEVIDKLEYVAEREAATALKKLLSEEPEITYLPEQSGPFVWRGTLSQSGMPLEVHFADADYFEAHWLLHSATDGHLAAMAQEGFKLAETAYAQPHLTENQIYEAVGVASVPAELREGLFEVPMAKEKQLPTLLETKDIRGVMHAHSVWSDGQHTLEQMAQACIEKGYDYLGITDHSQSAFYANGLDAARIKKQQEEIDQLNEKLKPFRIFKGIESDILNDGRLDYPDEVLASFDFIVASVHSNLKMDVQTATDRLLKAIANPYTTMLGHMTGRLLLKREGYPVDHEAVIAACAEHGVIIEINANPWRLDIDWRWVRKATESGVLISINPDAHEIDGIDDTRYGCLVARKGGLTPDMTFNAKSVEEVAEFFAKRKKG